MDGDLYAIAPILVVGSLFLIYGAAAQVWSWLYPKWRVDAAAHICLLESPTPASEPLVDPSEWSRMPIWFLLPGWRGSPGGPPLLQDDVLFFGKGSPCLIPFVPQGRAPYGAAVICPGGNYEFLTPQEGEPVARWLAAGLGLSACVLRYRLLPSWGLEDSMGDLRTAILRARGLANGGPVVAVGFSAGAHLIASVSADHEGGAADSRPDAQVLVYPMVDPGDWLVESSSGFWKVQVQSPQVKSLAVCRERLVPGPDFITPPPTFMASSTADREAPPERNSDLYARAAKAAGTPLEYLRQDFGQHGFCDAEAWRRPCLRWLRGQGFARAPSASRKKNE